MCHVTIARKVVVYKGQLVHVSFHLNQSIVSGKVLLQPNDGRQ